MLIDIFLCYFKKKFLHDLMFLDFFNKEELEFFINLLDFNKQKINNIDIKNIIKNKIFKIKDINIFKNLFKNINKKFLFDNINKDFILNYDNKDLMPINIIKIELYIYLYTIIAKSVKKYNNDLKKINKTNNNILDLKKINNYYFVFFKNCLYFYIKIIKKIFLLEYDINILFYTYNIKNKKFFLVLEKNQDDKIELKNILNSEYDVVIKNIYNKEDVVVFENFLKSKKLEDLIIENIIYFSETKTFSLNKNTKLYNIFKSFDIDDELFFNYYLDKKINNIQNLKNINSDNIIFNKDLLIDNFDKTIIEEKIKSEDDKTGYVINFNNKINNALIETI